MTPPRTHHRPCPSCNGTCPSGKYVCRDCWYLLPAAARTALSKRDKQAAGRLQELLKQLAAGAILDKIEISP
jgi:hypothetical protein